MKIHIDIDERHKRVELRAGWRPSIAEECKSIPGHNWSPTKKAWTYPLSMATLRRMRRVFGKELAPTPALLRWAKAERTKERRAKGYASHHDATSTNVAKIAPKLAEAMKDRTYQRSAAKFAKVTGSYLLADEPGLGKTATMLAGIMESGLWKGTHLVSCPKTAIYSTWVRQITLWTGATVYGVPEGAAKRRDTIKAFFDDPSETKFLVVNPAMLRRQYGKLCKACDVWEEDVKAGKAKFKKEHHITRGHIPKRTVRKEDWPEILNHEWTTFAVDESHEIFAAYKPSNITLSTQGMLDLKSQERMALTGTPLRGQEVNLWGTLDWLGAETGGYWAFVENYMEHVKGFFGMEVFGIDPERREDFHKLVDRYVIRRTRSEARPDLPLGQRVDVMVEMSPKHKKQYAQFEEDGEASILGGTLSGQGLLSELTRLKQLAWGEWRSVGGKLVPSMNSPKWEWIVEFLSARGITGKKTSEWLPEKGVAYKYVIASQFTEILDAMEEELTRRKIPTLKITGGVTGARREQAVAKFQSLDVKYRVMLIQTQTGGVSIDLDAWCDEMVITDETWVADDHVQLEGRINNRSGRVSPRMWHYLRTEGTIEQTIAERNWTQHDLQHKLLDGRRGVKRALHLIRGDG